MIIEPNMITVTLHYLHNDEVLRCSVILHRDLNENAAAVAMRQLWRDALIDLERHENGSASDG